MHAAPSIYLSTRPIHLGVIPLTPSRTLAPRKITRHWLPIRSSYSSSSSSMDEAAAGIEEYTTSTTGFTGILKHRYNDFQVFEVDLAGRTAHLTSTEVPQVTAAADEAAAGTASTSSALTEDSISEVVSAFTAVAGEANGTQLKKLLMDILQQQQQQSENAEQEKQAAGKQHGLELEVDLLPENDKETRKAIHQFIKSDPRLPPLLTETVASPAAADGQAAYNIIRIIPANAGGGRGGQGGQGRGGRGQGRGQKRGRREWHREPAWEGGDNKVVKFVMLKENMDTQAAIGTLSRMLHCQPRSFGFAGTKDKRGVTSQFVTLWKTPPARLAALNQRLRGIKLGNFEFAASPLSLGQLRGNTFKLLMRDLNTHDDEHIASAVAELREKGFINYFGLQRFGTGSVPTFKVGAALLRGEWKAAVQLIMQAGPDDRQDYRAARELYTNKGDVQACLKALPTFLTAERAIMQTLVKAGSNSYLAALQAIPRTLRSMYMHAWQSWLWNRAASERVRRYGADKVVTGDLVLLTDHQLQQGTAPAPGDSSADADMEQLYQEDEQAANNDDLLDAAAGSAASRLAAVHIVTDEEAAAGTFSIQDVVLPMPGGKVQYPKHEAGWQFYCKLAAADGVMLPGMTADEFAKSAAAAAAEGRDAAGACASSRMESKAAVPAAHSAKDFQLSGLSGDYRKLLHVPSDMQHRVVRYTHPDQEGLMPSDWDELQQQSSRQQKRQKVEDGQQQPLEQEPGQGGQQDKQLAGSAGQAAAATASTAATNAAEEAKGSATDGREMVAVVLQFTLPSSCYATMLVRELTKSSTSKASHKELSSKAV